MIGKRDPLANASSRRFHGKDLRKGRFSETGRVYLVTSATAERRPVFQNFELGRLVVQEFRAAHELGLAESLSFVVMPDHFHWLLALRDISLSRLLQRVKSRSAVSINKRLGARQSVWQKGFYDHAVRKEEDMQSLARYVVANPLRAGIVKRIGDYPLWDAVWLSES